MDAIIDMDIDMDIDSTQDQDLVEENLDSIEELVSAIDVDEELQGEIDDIVVGLFSIFVRRLSLSIK